MTITMDADTVIAELRAVVEEFGPDHKVDRCSYVSVVTDNTQHREIVPNCIVGQVWNRLGVDVDTLSKIDKNKYNDKLTGSALPDLIDLPFEMTEGARYILTEAQTIQDGPRGEGPQPWGLALEAAERWYKKVK